MYNCLNLERPFYPYYYTLMKGYNLGWGYVFESTYNYVCSMHFINNHVTPSFAQSESPHHTHLCLMSSLASSNLITISLIKWEPMLTKTSSLHICWVHLCIQCLKFFVGAYWYKHIHTYMHTFVNVDYSIDDLKLKMAYALCDDL